MVETQLTFALLRPNYAWAKCDVCTPALYDSVECIERRSELHEHLNPGHTVTIERNA